MCQCRIPYFDIVLYLGVTIGENRLKGTPDFSRDSVILSK